MAKVYDAVLRLKDEFSKQLKNAEKHMDNFNAHYSTVGNKLIKKGKSIEKIGLSMTKGLTVPLLALGTMAGKAYIDFEDAFAGVRKTVDASEAEFKVLERGIRDMALEIPVAAEELAGIAESAGQLGIAKENILDFTRVIADLSSSTNLGEDAAEQLAQFANITGMSQENFSNLGSTIVALGNNFQTTEADIVAMGMRLAGTGSQVGLSEAQILGLSTAMSSVGINAEAGGGSMSRVMQKINTEVLGGGKNLKNFAKISGMSSKEFSKAWKENPQEAITSFIKGLDDIKQSGGDVAGTLKKMGITSTQEIDTLARLSGAHEVLNDAMNLAGEAWEENTALTKEAEEKYKTLASVLKITWNNVKELAISFGAHLAPYIEKAAGFIKDITVKFNGLDDGTKKTIVKVAMFVAALGPVVFGVGKVHKVVGKGVLIFGNMSKAITKAGGIMKWVATGPVGLIVAGIVAVIAVIALVIANWDAIKAKAEEIFPGIGETISNIFNNLKTIFGLVVEDIKEKIDVLITVFGAIWSFIGPAVMGVVDGIKIYIEMLINIFDGIIQFITGVFTGNWSMAWEGVKKIFSSLWDGLLGIAKKVMNGIIKVINKVIGGLNKLQLPDWVPLIGGKGINIPLIPEFAKGTNYFEGGLARINERGGEIVDLPRGSRIYPHDKSVQMARNESGGQSNVNYIITIPKIADQIIVREDADIEKLIAALYKKLKKVEINTPKPLKA